ncbi:helix-turn-helix domain-containing protein [Streptomyces sp. NBC_00102]|uniref:helix-turn-helix domain-containing protein n=1 Tax=Streptomyces sp. NBC_00102 TaxID=2975652 RepID=UPI00224F91CA|nr:helix-turn-helix domain-containing protein [Streptomyces sp. NBC_00102]MCX5400762.1 helix-turn-helix domain-containing protein [Streptomyces sp. NBC_00102]
MEALCTTEAVPIHQRPAYWQDAVSRMFPSVDVDVPHGECRGTLRLSQLGPVRAITVQGEAMRIHRSARSAAADLDDSLIVVTPTEGTVLVDQGDGGTRVSPGATAFCDLTRPLSMDFSPAHQAKCLVVPRWLLSLRDDELRRLTATPVRPDSRSGSLLSLLLTQLVNTAPTLPPGTGETLVRNVVDLICVLAGEQLHRTADDRPEAAQHLTRRIQEYIDRHLGDPDLTPGSIARVHNISVRYLHKLFEHEGITVSRWVQRRRLHECRCELASRTASGRTVSAVARRWGFTSAAHFSRAFRTTYDISPAEWRRLARQKTGAPASPGRAGEHEAAPGPLSRSADLRPAGYGTGAEAA